MKKFMAVLCMAASVLFVPVSVMAAGEGTEEILAEEDDTDPSGDQSEGDIGDPAKPEDDSTEDDKPKESKPFLALGKDLTEEQLTYVLNEMGISRDNLEEYRVIYVTNEEEHQKLDSYIDPSVIGTKALSCVMVKPNSEGYGIRVTTKNINYCTVSMYKNALLTAGVENADVTVVGPFPISGTAALIGAWHAYEEMTGEELKEEAKTTALDEIITIGNLTDELSGEDPQKVEEMIDYIKAEVIANGIEDADDIKDVIKKAEDEFDIHLSDKQTEDLTNLMGKISSLDIDPKKLIEQAGDLYDKYGDSILAEAKDAINGIITDDVKKSFWQSITGFFKTFFESVKNYISSK